MAQIGAVKALTMVVMVLAMVVISGSAQSFDSAPAPAPGPGQDEGAASLQAPLSGAVIFSSLFLSLLLAILKH